MGALTINQAVVSVLNVITEKDIQIVWQTGKNYFDQYRNLESGNVKIYPFIDEMNFAYSVCDLLIARAGATTIAELLVLGIPSVLVPSPNVAENHQYFNAKSLSENNAAVLIEDKNLMNELADKINYLFGNEGTLSELKKNALALAKPDAAEIIAKNAIKYAKAI